MWSRCVLSWGMVIVSIVWNILCCWLIRKVCFSLKWLKWMCIISKCNGRCMWWMCLWVFMWLNLNKIWWWFLCCVMKCFVIKNCLWKIMCMWCLLWKILIVCVINVLISDGFYLKCIVVIIIIVVKKLMLWLIVEYI